MTTLAYSVACLPAKPCQDARRQLRAAGAAGSLAAPAGWQLPKIARKLVHYKLAACGAYRGRIGQRLQCCAQGTRAGQQVGGGGRCAHVLPTCVNQIASLRQ